MLAKPSFDPKRRYHLGVGIELHAETAIIVGRLRLAEPRNALRRRVTVRTRLRDRLDHLVDDMLRRRHIGIAHAEIDDIRSARSGRRFQPVYFGEYVGRQALDAMESPRSRAVDLRAIDGRGAE